MIEVNKIYNEDCLTGLKKLPDNCVNCCVTSPPYYGLRDYGTAKWEGGDKNCSHDFPQGGRNPETSGKQLSNAGTTKHQYRDICPKCDAKRIDKQIGLEKTPELYVEKMVEVFTQVKRVLKKDGTLWLNIGDSYAGGGRGGKDQTGKGSLEEKRYNDGLKIGLPTGRLNGIKSKDLIGVPWMVAFALRADGWYLRQDIIWHKPNPMPESVADRCTKSHEYIFLLSKSAKYHYDHEAVSEKGVMNAGENRKGSIGKGPIKEPTGKVAAFNHSGEGFVSDGMRNKRSVWTVNTKPYLDAHFATFPEDLIVDMIKAGCPENGIVLDPFMGAGTTALVASKLDRHYVGFELNADYIKIAERRLQKELGMFNKAQ